MHPQSVNFTPGKVLYDHNKKVIIPRNRVLLYIFYTVQKLLSVTPVQETPHYSEYLATLPPAGNLGNLEHQF